MPRFGLREFSVPDYRGSLPAYDENNALWPRISQIGKMLHDMSWEDGEYDDGTGRTDEERAADFERDARENVKTSEDRKMDGYSEYLDDQSRLSEDEKKTLAAEQQLEDERNRKNIGFGGDRSGGMDRQRQLAEGTAERREPGEWGDSRTASPTRRKAEEIVEVFPNANMDEIGTFFPEQFRETEASKQAMKQYMDKMRWEDEMQGYRPLPTR